MKAAAAYDASAAAAAYVVAAAAASRARLADIVRAHFPTPPREP